MVPSVMRTMYENQTDRDNEQGVITFACREWGYDAHKLPISYGLDYALSKENRIVGYAEVKRRHNLKNKYPTIFIAQHKWMSARALELPCIWVVAWNDCLGYINFNTPYEYIAMGGRKDRSDPADQEPMVHWDTNNFITLWMRGHDEG